MGTTTQIWIAVTIVLLASGCVLISEGLNLPRSVFCRDNNLVEKIPCPPDTIPGGSCYLTPLLYEDAQCKHLGDLSEFSVVEGLADVRLNPYQFRDHRVSRPFLNISISNVKFTELTLRFAGKCLKFYVSNEANAPSETTELFWDCRIKKQYIVSNMTLEYRALYGSRAEYRKFALQLPQSDNIDVPVTDSQNLELLIYREDHSRGVTFYWASPPAKYNVSKYKVILSECECNWTNVTKCVPVKEWQTLLSNKTSHNIEELPKYSTCYNISVQPFFGAGDAVGWGRHSYSQQFFADPPPLPLAALVIVSILFLMLIIFCCLYFSTVILYKRISKFNKCIVVYEPTSYSHLKVVHQLALFLQSLHSPVLFAETEIKRMDATDWWGAELNDADLIVIVSNPPAHNRADIYKASTYAPVFEQGFVKESLRALVRNSSHSRRYVKILLPYCKKDEFYDFLGSWQCYHIFKDRLKLLQEIIGPHNVWLPTCISWFMYSEIFKAESWKTLKLAIRNFSESADSVVKTEAIELNEDESLQSLTTLPSSSSESDLSDKEDANDISANVKLQWLQDSSDCESECSIEQHSLGEGFLNKDFYQMEVSEDGNLKDGMNKIDKFFGLV